MARRPTGAALEEFAPAKVNLTLRVLGRRADGYHEIESLVAFARIGDHVSFAPGPDFAIEVSGPTAAAAGSDADNLILKAARALRDRADGLTFGRFHLTKRLPVAAGLGGGSADAAAALRLLARANGIGLDDPRLMQAAMATGADVPVCLASRARVMRGIGEALSEPLDLSPLPVVLVNPGVAVATKDVFAALQLSFPPQLGGEIGEAGRKSANAWLESVCSGANDLEPAAIALAPVIADVLLELRALPGCRLARMSGSGATCFGLFDGVRRAQGAARTLRASRPGWWIRAAQLGAG